ncbi:sulfate/molybdate ABC transporter ATP-binding protein [Zavarzinia sp. CC-PAN008]|uniref:sulfate/molybdate ABC transporter ATP-binding protein n=1 Tax=Zavarzinia sp. CC-PAN008 TaxID=3243332 RepID=UPI003F745826
MSIEVSNVVKTFGSFTALNHVDLKIESGEFVALLGPSGSGKTTLLRILAGLDFADSGTLHFEGEDIAGRSARDRRVGFVFQHYALFRHMTVAQNVAFGLEVKRGRERPPRAEIQARVDRLLNLVQLKGFGKRYPNQLSGGQRQRVALARALAIEPKVLLLDEPFGALDAKVRKDLRRWLRQLHAEVGLTSIFVTHDQEEALELADRVVVMSQGQIEQVGTPAQVYRTPATAFVTEFLGNANRLTGTVRNGRLQIGDWSCTLEGEDLARVKDGMALAYVRPYDIEVLPEGSGEGLTGRLHHVFPSGNQIRLEIQRDTDGAIIEVETPEHDWLPPIGSPLVIRPQRVRVFPAGPGQSGALPSSP